MNYKYETIKGLLEMHMEDEKGNSHSIFLDHLMNIETGKKVYVFSVIITNKDDSYLIQEEFNKLEKAVTRLDIHMMRFFKTK